LSVTLQRLPFTLIPSSRRLIGPSSPRSTLLLQESCGCFTVPYFDSSRLGVRSPAGVPLHPCSSWASLVLVKRILRYFMGTLSYRLHIGASSVQSLASYSDADWVRCPDSRCSTSGFCVYLGDNFISWPSKCHTTVSWSSVEVEYRDVAHAVAECCWFGNF
jgi:hypothetical protein